MPTSPSTRIGHQALDYPEIWPHRYHVPTAVCVVFLFRLPTPDRERILHTITAAGATTSPENVNRPIGIVPWLRSFEVTDQDVSHFTAEYSILIDKSVLENDMCIACHGLKTVSNPNDKPTFEFARVKLTEAYDLVTSAKWGESWFPDTLPQSAKLEYPAQLRANITSNLQGIPNIESEIPIFVVVDITTEQRTQLLELLDCDMATATLIDVVNTSDELDDIDHLMEFFLARAWFPGDFAVIDAQTVAELPPKTQANEVGDEPEGMEVFPSFLLATSLQLHHKASDDQSVGMDEVGYAVGRRRMEDEEEYSLWCGNVFRGMGLRSWIGEDYDRYYWACWLDENGKVDAEVRAEADVRY